MQFKQLEAFAAVVKHRSFSRAADELYLTQPTVSAHLKSLEDEIGIKLIERSTRSIALTEAGEAFYPYVKRILELRDAGIGKITRQNHFVLHIGASTIPSSYILPVMLTRYREKNPDVFFNVIQNDSRGVMDMLLDETIDIGIIGMKPDSPELSAKQFCRDTMVAAAPATEYYQKLFSGKPDMQKILQEPLILREQGSGTLHALDQYFKENNIDPSDLNVIGYINDPESIKQMIINRLGISILSGFATRDLAATGQLICFPIKTKHPRQFYLVKKKTRLLDGQSKDFLQFAEQFYS